MVQKHSIYDDMEFESTPFNSEISNPQAIENSSFDINPALIIGVILIFITAAGAYYWTRKKYEHKSNNWFG